jgi:hypothetical protein
MKPTENTARCPRRRLQPVVSVKWDRRLWGVKFSSPKGGAVLIGEGWDDSRFMTRHDGEPTRTLLFTTRAAARKWCKTKMDKCKDRNDCCADWVFTPVRVRELVDVAR